MIRPMKLKFLSVAAMLFMAFLSTYAQYNLPFGFEKKYDIPVKDSLGDQIINPWAGGLNACQFNAIDLDYDGIKDLVIFDRNGNRTLSYKNLGIAGEVSYEFSPGLAKNLPHFDDWVIFADYNMDGLNDIFTYSKGFAGIKVYKNTGNIAIPFELVVSPYLKSFQGSGYVNILVTYADYPAIADIDNDGDLDILSFWGLGAFVEFHLNESMELYGTPDSLIYRKTDNCWGRFAESEESNIIYLDTCFEFNNPDPNHQAIKREDRHTGSTFMVFDENGDGLLDLLLGDVDYSSPTLLINGGMPDDAFMISHTFTYPAYDIPINLLSFPVMNYLDVNNDNRRDMIVSTFDPSLVKAQNINNIWFYQNMDDISGPVFNLKSKALFQEDMLDFGAGSVPVLFDYNNDGLMDIVVGNFGYFDSAYYGQGMNLYCNYRSQLALLENVGTLQSPQFRLINRNWVDIPSYFPGEEPLYAAVPAFGDLDGDNDSDMLLGNAEGNLVAFENNASTGEPVNFVLSNYNYQNIDAGYFSAPQLFDLNADGLMDLVIGKRNGTISWYQNTGTSTNPIFTLATDSLGKVDVRDPNLSVYGYCIPHFFKDSDGNTHLFAGSEFGNINYYTGIDNNLDGAFKLVMKRYLWIDEGLRSAVAVGYLNNDSYPDMIVGNYSGGLSWFEGTTPPPARVQEYNPTDSDIRIYPNPANDFLNIQLDKCSEYQIDLVEIFDFSGRKVISIFTTFGQENIIDVSTFDGGIYLLIIDFLAPGRKHQTRCEKIIIQH